MHGSSNSAEFANPREAGGVASTRVEFGPDPGNSSVEVLREVIGRKMMTWISAGTLQHSEEESERERKGAS